MSQVPPPYVPQTDFATLAMQPIIVAGLPGTQLDQEFADVADSINATEARLSEIQRDDGALKNGIVTSASLSSEVLAIIEAGNGSILGGWRPNTSYTVGDIVTVQAINKIEIAPLDSPFLATYMANFPNAPMYAFPLEYASGRLRFASYAPGSPPATGQYWYLDSPGPGYGWILQILSNFTTEGRWVSSTDVFDPADAVGWAADYGYAAGQPYLLASKSSNPGTYICVSDHVSSNNFDDDLSKWGLVGSTAPAGDLVRDDFTGDGSQTVFNLAKDPLNINNTQVFLGTAYQQKNLYSLSGTQITFVTPPGNGVKIEVISGVSVEVALATVANNSVGTNQLIDGAVTEDKIDSGAVTASKVAAGAVGTTTIQDSAITAAKLASNSVTVDKIAAGQVSETKLADGAVTSSKLGNSSVGSAAIAAGAVTTSKIPDGAVTSPKIGNGEVKTVNIADANVTAAKLAADAAKTNLGYTPVNKAGDTMTGDLNLGAFAAIGKNLPKAICTFVPQGTNGACTLDNSYNVTSVTRSAVGTYNVVMTNALADAKYGVIGSGGFVTSPSSFSVTARTSATAFTLKIYNASNVAWDSPDFISFAVYR